MCCPLPQLCPHVVPIPNHHYKHDKQSYKTVCSCKAVWSKMTSVYLRPYASIADVWLVDWQSAVIAPPPVRTDTRQLMQTTVTSVDLTWLSTHRLLARPADVPSNTLTMTVVQHALTMSTTVEWTQWYAVMSVETRTHVITITEEIYQHLRHTPTQLITLGSFNFS